MITFSLQSGSNGNCIYVEAGEVRLLFDAGISGSTAEKRMVERKRNIRDCDAILISHDHWDHAACAGIFARKFGLPLYMTPRVRQAIRPTLGKVHDIRQFLPGERITFGDVTVHTLLTPHDGIDTVAFIVEHDGKRLGVMTDLGSPFKLLADAMETLDAAYLESNFDPHMLRTGPYTESTQRRIAGRGGHLSNEDAANLVFACRSPRLKWVATAHISECNNRPELAVEAHRNRIGAYFDVHIAGRHEAGPVLEV